MSNRMRIEGDLQRAVVELADELVFAFGVDQREAQQLLIEALRDQKVIGSIRSRAELKMMEETCRLVRA